MKKNIYFTFAILALVLSYSCQKMTPFEKKAYKFTLLERSLISHPEKLEEILVVITDNQDQIDTLSSAEADKLMTRKSLKETRIILPYGEDFSLILTKNEDTEITAFISEKTWGEEEGQKPFLQKEESWLYIYGKKFDLHHYYNDDEYSQSIFDALSQAKRIIRNV